MKLRLFIVGSIAATLWACSNDAGTEAEVTAQSEAKSQTPPTSLPRSASPDGARVFFITPADGSTVTNPISVEFGIDGMAVVAAGTKQEDSGHHHLLIDTDLPDLGLPIPADELHIHFGDASTATEITLAPGEHRLQMLLGDYLHIPHDPPLVSESITIIVE